MGTQTTEPSIHQTHNPRSFAAGMNAALQSVENGSPVSEIRRFILDLGRKLDAKERAKRDGIDRYHLTLKPMHQPGGPDPEMRLKMALKTIGRRYGFKCVALSVENEG